MVVRERQNRKHRVVRGGYTLMEMLVVVAIIVVLAGIGGYLLLPRLQESKENIDLAQTKTLTQACETFQLNNGRWPTSLQELTTTQPNGGRPIVDQAAIMSRSQPDKEFTYDPSGGNNGGLKPDIWIVAADGRQIGNWMQHK
jgi:prepilin-type N-terminal cleavage/methylation domain-containing protein